jgi:hypothetical protein
MRGKVNVKGPLEDGSGSGSGGSRRHFIPSAAEGLEMTNSLVIAVEAAIQVLPNTTCIPAGTGARPDYPRSMRE